MIFSEPILTELFESSDEYIPEAGTVLFRGNSTEERHFWYRQHSEMLEVSFFEDGPFSIRGSAEGSDFTLSVRSRSDIVRLVESFVKQDNTLLLDLTSLPYFVWIPVLKVGLSLGLNVHASYSEPVSYTESSEPSESEIFELSERIEGIRPIPGFASFSHELSDDFILIALLGFEGRRFSYVVENVQPKGNNIIPIIGAPGFLPEFVFHAFLGNRYPLLENSSYLRTVTAPANCPFSLVGALKQIGDRFPQRALKIALVGTKPHALGAFIYQHQTRREIEFIYDNPIRKRDRTMGLRRLSVYRVSDYLNDA